jgi:hypothetical protein
MEVLVNNGVSKLERPERRGARRHRVLKGGVLTFGGIGAFEAIVRNLSDKGAMLSFGDATGVPKNFDLAISGEGAKRQAQLRWRLINLIGIEFV